MAWLIQDNHAFHNSSQNQIMREEIDRDLLPVLDERINEDIDEYLFIDLSERENFLDHKSIKAAIRKSYCSY